MKRKSGHVNFSFGTEEAEDVAEAKRPRLSLESLELGKHIVARMVAAKERGCPLEYITNPLAMESEFAKSIRSFIDESMLREPIAVFMRMCIVAPGKSPQLPGLAARETLSRATSFDFERLWNRVHSVFSRNNSRQSSECFLVTALFVRGGILAQDLLSARWYHDADVLSASNQLSCAEIASFVSHPNERVPYSAMHNARNAITAAAASEWLKPENKHHAATVCEVLVESTLADFRGRVLTGKYIGMLVDWNRVLFEILVPGSLIFADAAFLLAPLDILESGITRVLHEARTRPVMDALISIAAARPECCHSTISELGISAGPASVILGYFV